MKIEVKVPAAGESVTEAEIASWRKQTGDQVERDEVLLEVETDKATLEVRAESAGVLTVLSPAGTTVKVGATIASIDTDAKGAKTATGPASKPAPVPLSTPAAGAGAKEGAGESKKSSYAQGVPSPAAARILSEKNLEADLVKGTGPGGRITKEDAMGAQVSLVNLSSHKEESLIHSENGHAAGFSPVPGSRNIRREKMSRLRRTIANRLVEAKQSMALLTTFNEVDMSAIMEFRKKYKEIFKEKNQTSLGFMSFFTKAVCQALQEFPVLNASVEVENVAYHDYCDIGIAVATPKGLVVPVIRNAERLSFKEIEATIADLGRKGRDGKLSPEEMEGGTFTITNGGTFGSMLSTPIVNKPQSAILGMHNIVERPVAVNGQVVIRPIMYLAVTYDHRIIDGADSVRFLVRVKEMLEDPTRLLVGV